MKWWHGDSAERAHFEDQRWDRDARASTLNAGGPGLYFTSSRSQAESYGLYLYSAELSPAFRVMRRSKPTMRFLLGLAKRASEASIARFLADWDCVTLPLALERYCHQDTRHDAAVALYGDLFKEAERWIQALVEMGYHGVVVRAGYGTRHLVVWEPRHLIIERVT